MRKLWLLLLTLPAAALMSGCDGCDGSDGDTTDARGDGPIGGALQIAAFYVEPGEPIVGTGIVVRIHNRGDKPVRLRVFADHHEVDEKLIEGRRKASAFSEPYQLGLEQWDPFDKEWTEPIGYRWGMLEKIPEDEPGDEAHCPPGGTRSFSEIIPGSYGDVSFRAFILDPAGGRIDEKVLELSRSD